MTLKLFGALGALALAAGAAFAEGQDDYGQDVSMDGPGIAQPVNGNLTLEQRRALYLPRGPRPGVYRMRALHSGNCIFLRAPLNFGSDQTWIAQSSCQAPDAPAQTNVHWEFAFVPHPAGGYTVRSDLVVSGGRAPVPGTIPNCLTVAPGVVFGPARMELRACEIPNGLGWDSAGAEGQRFTVQRVASDAWELRLADSNPENPDCVAARGGSRDLFSDYIKWGCNGNADQRFILEWARPIPAGVEAPTLARSKYFPLADGHYRLSPAWGVDLSGASYASFETIDDKGEYCMRRCAELTECKAWTWTGPGYVGNDPPKCYWKHTPGTPINRGKASFGKLASGIVRP